jgi:hypothetical protein
MRGVQSCTKVVLSVLSPWMISLCRLDEGEPGGLGGFTIFCSMTEALCFFGEGEQGSL